MGIHKKTKKRVAIKIINKPSMNAKNMDLLRYEIETLKICQHPNILRLLDIFETLDTIYLVTELLEGGDLFSYLKRVKFHVTESRARKIIHSLGTALFYLHSYGIVHRDIKPENIMMKDKTENSDVKIVDFGLAKIIGGAQTSKEICGTLNYIAPEMLNGEPYGKSIDIWSLGILTYLLLMGKLPFDDKDDAKLTGYYFESEE